METNNKPHNIYAFACMTESFIQEGMTLRDYFADSASRVLLVLKDGNFSEPTDKDYDEWAKRCYRRADALLKQREL